MNELIARLLGWKRMAKRGDEYFNPKEPVEKPGKKKPKPPAKPVYPEGASEAEKLRIAQERIRAQREAQQEVKSPRRKKSWYQKGLWDLF